MNYSTAATDNTALRSASFKLELNKENAGEFILTNALCQFEYKWDFIKNAGIAYLIEVNGLRMNIKLHPTSNQGMWDFISDIVPTRYLIGNRPVIIYRVALNIDLFTGVESAAILFGQRGSDVITTNNFDPYCTAIVA